MSGDLFTDLRALRTFERRHLPFLQTTEDRDLLLEIGYREEQADPVTRNDLRHCGIGAPATIERRLERLRRNGVVLQRLWRADARKRPLSLHPRIVALYRRYWRLHQRLAQDRLSAR